jgi:hypothetical protein
MDLKKLYGCDLLFLDAVRKECIKMAGDNERMWPSDRRDELPEGNMFRSYGNDLVVIPEGAQGELFPLTATDYEAQRAGLSDAEIAKLFDAMHGEGSPLRSLIETRRELG